MTCQSPVIFILKHIKVNFTLYIFQGEQKRRLKTSVWAQMRMKLLNKQIREHLLRVLLTVIFFFQTRRAPIEKKLQLWGMPNLQSICTRTSTQDFNYYRCHFIGWIWPAWRNRTGGLGKLEEMYSNTSRDTACRHRLVLTHQSLLDQLRPHPSWQLSCHLKAAQRSLQQWFIRHTAVLSIHTSTWLWCMSGNKPLEAR